MASFICSSRIQESIAEGLRNSTTVKVEEVARGDGVELLALPPPEAAEMLGAAPAASVAEVAEQAVHQGGPSPGQGGAQTPAALDQEDPPSLTDVSASMSPDWNPAQQEGGQGQPEQ